MSALPKGVGCAATNKQSLPKESLLTGFDGGWWWAVVVFAVGRRCCIRVVVCFGVCEWGLFVYVYGW